MKNASAKVVDGTNNGPRVETEPLSFNINKDVFRSADGTLAVSFTYIKGKESGKQMLFINLEGQNKTFGLQVFGMDNGKGVHVRTDNPDYQFIRGESKTQGRKSVSC